MIGDAAGLTFWYDGGWMSGGSWRSDFEMAALTSWAASSTLRSRENCSVICVEPTLLVLVMLSMPAIVESCFSSGVATDAAIVCGLAPGRLALTVTVG